MERFFAILLLAALARASVFDQSDSPKFFEECVAIHKVSPDPFVPGPNAKDPAIWQQQPYRCLARCMFRKFEAITKDDEINADKLMPIFAFTDKAKMSECATTCDAENKQEDKCDKAFARKNCVLKCMRA